MKLATGLPSTTMVASVSSEHPLSGWTMVRVTGRMALVWGPAFTVVESSGGSAGSNPTRVSLPTVHVQAPLAMPMARGTPVDRFSRGTEVPMQTVSGRLISASTMAGMSKLTWSVSVQVPMLAVTVAVAV